MRNVSPQTSRNVWVLAGAMVLRALRAGEPFSYRVAMQELLRLLWLATIRLLLHRPRHSGCPIKSSGGSTSVLSYFQTTSGCQANRNEHRDIHGQTGSSAPARQMLVVT